MEMTMTIEEIRNKIINKQKIYFTDYKYISASGSLVSVSTKYEIQGNGRFCFYEIYANEQESGGWSRTEIYYIVFSDAPFAFIEKRRGYTGTRNENKDIKKEAKEIQSIDEFEDIIKK